MELMDSANEGSLETINISFSSAIFDRLISVEALSSDKTVLFFNRRIAAIGLDVS
jgi:hypothetical protein